MILISQALNEHRLLAIMKFLDLGNLPARVEVYAGPRATLVTDPVPPTAIKLITLILKKPCGYVSEGALTLEQELSNMAMATGEPAWARFINGAGATAFDCDAGGPAVLGNWELKMSQDVLYAGGYASMADARIR